MQHPATVRIASPVSGENPHGFVVINEADFDPAAHEAWSEPQPDEEDGAEDEPASEGQAPAGRRRRARS